MSKPLRIQIRVPDGKPLRLNLNSDTTYAQLLTQIANEKPDLGDIIIHAGFPPQEVDASNPNALLTNLGIKSGTTINVELSSSSGTVIQGSGCDLPPTVDPSR